MTDHTMKAHRPDPLGIEYGTRRLAEGIIGGLCDLAEHLGVDLKQGDTPDAVINRIRYMVHENAYRGRGLYFSPFDNGKGVKHIVLRGYCQGITRKLNSYTFMLDGTGTIEQFDTLEEKAELEAIGLWLDTHGCSDCNPPDANGYRLVRPDCPFCGGVGVLL